MSCNINIQVINKNPANKRLRAIFATRCAPLKKEKPTYKAKSAIAHIAFLPTLERNKRNLKHIKDIK